MFPLFGAIPGGAELLIMFVVMLFMLGIPLAFGVGLFLLGRWSADSDDEEVELLRDRVNTLEEKVAAREELSSAGEEGRVGEARDDTDRER